jgi:hypothetical protein
LNIDKRLREAVQSYWNARAANKEKQQEGGKIDAGTRSEVTGGTQMGPWRFWLLTFFAKQDSRK